MDKRLFSLLIVAYSILTAFFLALISDEFLIGNQSSIAAPVAWIMASLYVVAFLALFVLFFMAILFAILEIMDAMVGRQNVDGRYFTRCWTYQLAFLAWPCLLITILSLIADTANNTTGHGGDMLIPIIPAVAAAVVMSLTASLHVISGLSSLKKQKVITKEDFTLHLMLLLFCGMGNISSLILVLSEWTRHKNAPFGFFRSATAKRQLPAAGFFSASLFLTALLAGNNIFSLIRIGVTEYVAHFHDPVYWPVRRLLSNFSLFYFFFFLIIICAVIDAIRFSRKMPVGLLSQSFIINLISFSVIAIVLESMLATILLLFTASLAADFSTITENANDSSLIAIYILFIAINAVAILAIQAITAYYTWHCIKRAQSDGVLSEETALLFKQNAIYPVAQLVAVFRLKRLCRDREN